MATNRDGKTYEVIGEVSAHDLRVMAEAIRLGRGPERLAKFFEDVAENGVD
jgi:hypothetical protein